MALLKGHVGLVPRLLQPSPNADVLDDSEPQDPVVTACLGRLRHSPRQSPELTGRWGLIKNTEFQLWKNLKDLAALGQCPHRVADVSWTWATCAPDYYSPHQTEGHVHFYCASL